MNLCNYIKKLKIKMANLNQELVKNLNGIFNANYSERAARYEEVIILNKKKDFYK